MSDPKTSVASYTAATAAMVTGGLTVNEVAALIGAACAVGTFLVNWYYKHQQFKLTQIRDCDE